MTDNSDVPAAIEQWNARLSAALGIPAADADSVLDLAAVVAHSVVRPAAPLGAYLVGYATAIAVAAGADPDAAFAEAVATAEALAAEPGA